MAEIHTKELYKTNHSVVSWDPIDNVKEEDLYQYKELFSHFEPDGYGRIPTKHLKSVLNWLINITIWNFFIKLI